mgnify:CR=1 FL=1
MESPVEQPDDQRSWKVGGCSKMILPTPDSVESAFDAGDNCITPENESGKSVNRDLVLF